MFSTSGSSLPKSGLDAFRLVRGTVPAFSDHPVVDTQNGALGVPLKTTMECIRSLDSQMASKLSEDCCEVGRSRQRRGPLPKVDKRASMMWENIYQHGFQLPVAKAVRYISEAAL